MAHPRHGDSQDYPDIPSDSGLGQAYYDAVTPAHVKERIAKRRNQSSRFEPLEQPPATD